MIQREGRTEIKWKRSDTGEDDEWARGNAADSVANKAREEAERN